MKSAKWHAERANLSKSRFLAAASHDLRQPLQTLSLVRGILAKKIKDKKDEEALNAGRQAQRDGGRSVGHVGHAPRHQSARDRERPSGKGRFPDQRPARAAEDRICLSCSGAWPHLARGSLPAEHSERPAPTRADDPQSALERGETHRARQDPARLPAARRQAAHRGLGHRHRHPRESSFARSSRSSISSTILPASTTVASASVSPSCNAWGICWAIPSMSDPVQARARSSQSRYRSEASSRRYLDDAGRATVQNAGRHASDSGRRRRSVGARDARSPVYKRGAPHCRRCGRQTSGGVGARHDKAGYRRRRLQSAERHDRPPGRSPACAKPSVASFPLSF